MNLNKNAGMRAYLSLSIDQRINMKSWRNALNINHLLSTVINDCNIGTPIRAHLERPLMQNGLYHHFGKYHSFYKKDYKALPRHVQRYDRIKVN